MPLLLSCPRCTREVTVSGRPGDTDVTCLVHGVVSPLARPHTVDFEGLREVSDLVPESPVYLPWPMSPRWSIADFGCVAGVSSATFTVVRGQTIPDGSVEVSVISEDPGVGLGARCAGVTGIDPGRHLSVEAGGERPAVYVLIESRAVPLWMVKYLDPDADPFATTAFAGEADGRWLWVVVRPASAALLMRDDWLLSDIAGISEEVLGMPFGGARPIW